MSKLVLRGITKSFGAVDAVEDFSLELQARRIRLPARVRRAAARPRPCA